MKILNLIFRVLKNLPQRLVEILCKKPKSVKLPNPKLLPYFDRFDYVSTFAVKQP